MNTPRASVLLPVRNAADTLDEALASLRAQTVADIEILVQDDGSTDDSLQRAEALAREDDRIRIESAPPQGIVAALNAAAARATAPWLVRMDADDVSYPHRIERLLAAADESPDVSFWASAIQYFPRATLSNGMQRYEAWINSVQTQAEIERDRFVECPMPHPAWMFRTELFRTLGGYRDGGPEDYDLVLRAVAHGATLQKIPEVLLLWREHPDRLSRTDPRYALERFRDCKAATLLPLLGGRPVAIIGAGRDGKRWARLLRDQGVAVEAFYDTHASRVGQKIGGVPVHADDSVPPPPGPVLLVTAGRARDTIRSSLIEQGHRELDTFYCVQ